GSAARHIDGADQPVTAPRQRFDIPRLSGIISKPLPNFQNVFLQILRLNKRVRPEMRKELFRRNQVATVSCQEGQEFKRLWGQTNAFFTLPYTSINEIESNLFTNCTASTTHRYLRGLTRHGATWRNSVT